MKTANQFNNPHKWSSFNMTPIIDIVFLLIIFFLVVCQFIEAENFPVTVPDDCGFAQEDTSPGVITVTAMKTAKGSCDFAVGSERITASNYANVVDKLAELIDVRLSDLPPGRRVVTLRIDKGVRFAEAQYALAGIAASTATDVRLAALRDKHTAPQ